MQQPSDEIHEGRGGFPWWVWLVIVAWMIYAFLVAPFDLTSPLN
jgi:hypothetical protein